VRKLRYTALNLADELGIEAKLEDRPAFGLAGQLGVDGFIGPTAEIARRIDLPEDVGATDPGARTQSALHDDVNAHRVEVCLQSGEDGTSRTTGSANEQIGPPLCHLPALKVRRSTPDFRPSQTLPETHRVSAR